MAQLFDQQAYAVSLSCIHIRIVILLTCLLRLVMMLAPWLEM